jgi:hypothetical protein
MFSAILELCHVYSVTDGAVLVAAIVQHELAKL